MNKQNKLRSVNTHFWDDIYVVDLDPTEKLLFLYFLTNPLTNLAGIYEVPLRKIAFDSGIDKDMISKILTRFEKDEKIYYRGGYIIFKNFTKNQNYNASMLKNVENSVTALPAEVKNFLLTIDHPVNSLYTPHRQEKDKDKSEIESESEDEVAVPPNENHNEDFKKNPDWDKKVKRLFRHHWGKAEVNQNQADKVLKTVICDDRFPEEENYIIADTAFEASVDNSASREKWTLAYVLKTIERMKQDKAADLSKKVAEKKRRENKIAADELTVNVSGSRTKIKGPLNLTEAIFGKRKTSPEEPTKADPEAEKTRLRRQDAFNDAVRREKGEQIEF